MSPVSRAGVLAAYRDGVTVICELAAWRGGMPQLWPELTRWDGDDPWHDLLTATGRDPGWVQLLDRPAGVES